jgi:hypothetical protein
MRTKFKYRSNEKELLDETNIQQDLLFKNMRELDILNRTYRWACHFVERHKTISNGSQTKSIISLILDAEAAILCGPLLIGPKKPFQS